MELQKKIRVVKEECIHPTRMCTLVTYLRYEKEEHYILHMKKKTSLPCGIGKKWGGGHVKKIFRSSSEGIWPSSVTTSENWREIECSERGTHLPHPDFYFRITTYIKKKKTFLSCGIGENKTTNFSFFKKRDLPSYIFILLYYSKINPTKKIKNKINRHFFLIRYTCALTTPSTSS